MIREDPFAFGISGWRFATLAQNVGGRRRRGWILAKVRCGLLPKYRGLNGKFRIRDLRRSIE